MSKNNRPRGSGNSKNAQRSSLTRVDINAPIEPIHIDVMNNRAEVEREPLFYIGDDEYTIPKEVPADFTVRYLNNVRKSGTEMAIAVAMTDLIGEDGMEALSNCPHMTNEHLQQIMKMIELKMLAASQAVLGE